MIPGGPYDDSVLLLFEHVDVHLALLLGLLLVEMNVGCIEVKVRRDDCLSPIDEEEGGVTGRVVYTCPEALVQEGDFIHPTADVDLELVVDAGLDLLENQPVGALDLAIRLGVVY